VCHHGFDLKNKGSLFIWYFIRLSGCLCLKRDITTLLDTEIEPYLHVKRLEVRADFVGTKNINLKLCVVLRCGVCTQEGTYPRIDFFSWVFSAQWFNIVGEKYALYYFHLYRRGYILCLVALGK
jgi:hypothetical protein